MNIADYQALVKRVERLEKRLARERKKCADIEAIGEQKTREYFLEKERAELMARVVSAVHLNQEFLTASKKIASILIDFGKIDGFSIVHYKDSQALIEMSSEHTSLGGELALLLNAESWDAVVFGKSAPEIQHVTIEEPSRVVVIHSVYRLFLQPNYFAIFSFFSKKKYSDFSHDLMRYCMSQLKLILERERDAKVLHNIQHFDELTQLCTRKVFQFQLTEAINQSSKNSMSVAVIALDIVKMSLYNSEYSIEFGNQLIKFLAEEFTKVIRNQDAITRYSGDGFLFYLVSDNVEQTVASVLDRIEQRFSSSFQWNNEKLRVEFHIGYCCELAKNTDAVSLIQNAEVALRNSKKTRQAPVAFSPELVDKALSTRKLEHDLQNALDNNEFRLFYQAIVDLSTNRIVKAEALIRWQKGERLIPPIEFIPCLEESDLIISVGRWIIRQALTDLKNWQHQNININQVGVNLSVKQFNDQSLDKWVDSLLSELGLLGSSLEFEITESLSLDSNSNMEQTLLEFRKRGIEVALDDFGTGYSSLSYLHRYPFSRLKIDRSFIMNLDDGLKSHKLLQSIIALSQSLEMSSVAEGIESKEVSRLMQHLGVDYGQGYYFNKPMPADQFSLLVQDWNKSHGLV